MRDQDRLPRGDSLHGPNDHLQAESAGKISIAAIRPQTGFLEDWVTVGSANGFDKESPLKAEV
jgi:hypothetical protein